MPNIELRFDVKGDDWIPHTFIVVTDPSGKETGYGFGPAQEGRMTGDGKVYHDQLGHEFNTTTGKLDITIDQYNSIMDYINRTTANPPPYYLPVGSQCATWAVKVLQEAGLPGIYPNMLPDNLARDMLETIIWNPYTQSLNTILNDWWQSATTWIRRDPLAIDLDGDGIETVALSPTAPITFDHNADGTKTGTGWLKGDDAWLVLDRDSNGAIDSGRELFGVDTEITVNGTTRNATNGFEALTTLDANGDKVFDAKDAAFTQVRLWRDLNQDGISQASELSTLASKSITAISLNYTSVNTDLGNGNTVTGRATVTRGGGSSEIDSVVIGGDTNANNLELADNPFYRQFTDNIVTTSTAQTLPNMLGAGFVRDLRDAMSLSADANASFITKALMKSAAQDLTNTVTAFAAATTRDAQMALIDQLIQQWGHTSAASTSGMLSASTPGDTRYQSVQTFAQANPDLYKKIIALEQFNGTTGLARWANNTSVNVPTAVVDLFNKAYNALRESVYQGLALQTRLRPYFDAVTLTIDNTGINFDTSALAAKLDAYKATDAKNAFIDLVELNRFAQQTLQAVGFDGISQLREWVTLLPMDSPIRLEFSGVHLFLATQSAGSDEADIYLGSDSNNTFSAGASDDVMDGGAGSDNLRGGDGNDTVTGGTGNDTLYGGEGADVYLFGKGSGQDTAYNSDGDAVGVNADTILLGSGISTSGLSLSRKGNDLIISLVGCDDSMRVQSYFNTDGSTSSVVENIKFADNTVWDVATVKSKVLNATTANDTLYGYATNDTISSSDGNDSLYGSDGNDSLNGDDGDDFLSGEIGDDSLTGGVGNDTLHGGTGRNTFIFGSGDGQDDIQQVYDTTADKLNTLLFKTGITASQIHTRRADDALVLSITGTSDQVWIESFFKSDNSTNPYNPVQQIKFTDSDATWDLATIKAKALEGDDSGQLIKGLAESDLINAAGGDDTVYGQTGNDSINAGTGNDTLYGGLGEDRLTGDDGNDYLYGETGNDTLTGSLGNDTLNGGVGNNTYIFGKGDGQDTISSVYDTTADKFSTLLFKTGVAASQISAKKQGNALALSINGTSDQIRIEGFYTSDNAVNPYNPVQQIKFTDSGEIWDLSTIKTKTQLNIYDLGFDSADLINMDDSWDTVYGMAGNDTINAGAGADNLYGGDGADSLNAADGNDTLYGESGDDTLTGGLGNDSLKGGTGNNTYVFGRGDGQDTIDWLTDSTADKLSTLLFKAGVAASQVTVKRWSSNDYVEFSVNGTSDKIGIQRFFYSPDSPVQQVKFTDGGVTWDLATITAKAVTVNETGQAIVGTDASESISATAGNDGISGKTGNDTINAGAGNDELFGGDGADNLNGDDGNDSLYGDAGDDTLVGGLGNDALAGGTGNNTYMFGQGDGQDKITEFYNTNPGRQNTLLFKTGVATSQVTARRIDSSLELSLNGTSDKVFIAGFFTSGNPVNSYNPVQQVKFADSGTIWDFATIKTKVTPIGNDSGQSLNGFDEADLVSAAGGNDHVYGWAGNDTINAGTGNDVLYAGDGADSLNGDDGNDYLYGEAGDDTLAGGLGNDTLIGGSGKNIYLFSKGDGQDNIWPDDTAGALSTLQFNAGIAASQVSVKRVDDNLELMINGTSDKVRIERFFTSSVLGPQVKFTDGAVTWDLATIKSKVLLGDETNQYLTGYDSADPIIAAGGADTIYGQGGNDTLNGGSGNDVVYGGDGVDSLTGDAGHDFLIGEVGNDTLTGGLGNDTLSGGTGNNTYVFGMGDGRDQITSYDTAVDKLNTLQFETGIAASQVSVKRIDNNLELVIDGSSDGILILDFFAGDNPVSEYNPVQQIKFTDGGVTWDLTALKTKALTGNETSQNILGLYGSDSINGDGGDDLIYGQAGNDTISAGTGNDTLYGGNGNDMLNGGNGDDSLSGEAGGDSLDGGDGNDWLNGDIGIDSLFGGNGDDTLFGGSSGITSQAVSSLVVYAKGTMLAGVGPNMDVWIDGVKVQTFSVNSTAYTAYTVTAPLGMNAKSIDVTFTNDAYYASEDRNLYVEKIVVSGKEIKGNTPGVILDYGSGTSAFDLSNAYRSNGSIGSNGSLRFGLGDNDYLNGGAGIDNLTGGVGNDVYIVDNTADQITESTNEGYDFAESSVTYTLAGNVEHLTLTGTGSINGTGNSLNNMLVGNSGVNLLNGGAGIDFMVGGGGNDTYVVDNASDVCFENAGGGIDVAESSASYALNANVENLKLTGATAINGTGNDLANELAGNAGNNALNGGAGDDTLNGGAGTTNRTVSSLVVFAKGTLVGGVGPKMEVWVDGVRVQTFDVNSTTYQAYTVTAPLGMNAKSIDIAFTNDAYSGSEDRNLYVEKIVVSGETLMGNAPGVVLDYGSGTGAFDWSNVYRANGSIGGNGSIRFGLGDNDYLNGGAGVDRLTGGVGNDVYIVDSTSDQITELTNEGYDFVESSVNYTLTGNLEQLTLTGTTNINGTGNALNNMMVGNSGINQLDGGAGADFMVGGGGNDTYIVDTAGDVCYENAGAGVDAVKSSITYTLSSNLENLTLTGTAAINGVGNSLANELTGNSANNTLYGGAGNDLYRGGAGSDSFSDSDTTSADRYVWGRNEGSDTLADAGGADQLEVLAGVSADQLWLQKSGNNLVLSVIGTSDKVTINNWYASAANQVELFKLSDGKSLTNTKVDNLVNAMASFTPPAAGQTTLPANYQTSLNGVIAANWQ